MIDLHAHTTASDGSCTPSELVALARSVGLSAVAVTDHDTVGGIPEALAAGEAAGLEVVPGIEISVSYPAGEFHLLGYFVDCRNAEFVERVRQLQDNRLNRNRLMVERMREHGVDISYEEVVAASGGGEVGRPHMAQVLVSKGYARDVPAAFDRFLSPGRPFHMHKVRLGPEEAIALVHQGSGLAVLAHPKYLGFAEEQRLRAELEALRGAGLDGLECYYAQHTEEETQRYLGLARELGLLVTGGSDFHGDPKPDVTLGAVYQGRPLGIELLAALKEKLASRRQDNREPV